MITSHHKSWLFFLRLRLKTSGPAKLENIPDCASPGESVQQCSPKRREFLILFVWIGHLVTNPLQNSARRMRLEKCDAQKCTQCTHSRDNNHILFPEVVQRRLVSRAALFLFVSPHYGPPVKTLRAPLALQVFN